MICKRWWLAVGLMAGMVGCDAGGGPSRPAPAASKDNPGSGVAGEQGVPPTDASKGLAPASTGGTSPAGSSDTVSKDAEGGEPIKAAAAADVKLSDAEVTKVKKLPEAEQAAALAQKVCPISGEHLGSMGMPKKVTAEGKTAYLCCGDCEEGFNKDPKAALAKIAK